MGRGRRVSGRWCFVDGPTKRRDIDVGLDMKAIGGGLVEMIRVN